MEFFLQNQADLMMVLSGVCGVMALFVNMTGAMSQKRKRILVLLELSAMLLLIADRRVRTTWTESMLPLPAISAL